MYEDGKILTMSVILGSLLASYLVHLYRMRRQLPLPPGPKELPFIGNLHQIPKINPWRKYKEWHERYGPVISVKYGPKIAITLGSHSAARDLLEKRSSIYSSRPRLLVVGDHVYRGRLISLLPYGRRWRIQHRIQASFLNSRMAQKYQILQDVESKQLLREILSSNNFSTIFYRYSASLIFTMTYGKRMMTVNEGEVKEFAKMVDEILEEVDSNMLVDTFPIFDHLPRYVAGWKERGARLYQRQVQLFEKHTNIAMKTSSWNWTKEAFQSKEGKQVDREEPVFTVGVLFEAANIIPMVLEEELDTVIGPDRLPTFEDIPSLMYVNAFIREVFRWRPITAGGMAHAVTEEDEYMGYLIPKGATVVANHWSLELDEELFERPHDFRPDRWIENPDLPESAFGFGRRACPGEHIGRSSVLLIIARVLWAYHIDYTYENGKKQDIDPWDMTQGPDSRPMPFKASFRIRSNGHQDVIEKEWLGSEKDADILLGRVVSM